MSVSIMNRVPVNKMACVLLNQCGCESEYKLNSLLEQRSLLKETATRLMKESAKSNFSKHKNRELIRQANKDLAALNVQLKPYDEHHRRETPKTYEQAFREEVTRVYGVEAFQRIDAEARKVTGG